MKNYYTGKAEECLVPSHFAILNGVFFVQEGKMGFCGDDGSLSGPSRARKRSLWGLFL